MNLRIHELDSVNLREGQVSQCMTRSKKTSNMPRKCVEMILFGEFRKESIT